MSFLLFILFKIISFKFCDLKHVSKELVLLFLKLIVDIELFPLLLSGFTLNYKIILYNNKIYLYTKIDSLFLFVSEQHMWLPIYYRIN